MPLNLVVPWQYQLKIYLFRSPKTANVKSNLSLCLTTFLRLAFAYVIQNWIRKQQTLYKYCCIAIQCCCFVQSCLFVRCWPGIFLVQYRGNSCNVGAAFATTGYYQKINRYKIKIAEKWCCSDDNAIGFCLCNVVWSLLGNIALGFYLCSVVPRELRQHWKGFFLVQCCLEPQGQHYNIGFFPLQCCPRSIKTTLHKIFPTQCCLEPVG